MPAIEEQIENFENLIRAALEEKYGGNIPRWPPEVPCEMNVLLRWRLSDFVAGFLAGGVYPLDRLERAVYDWMDIKLEVYFILEVDSGLYNRLIYNTGHTERDSPYFRLIHFSLDQTVIAKSRILWERIMNLVYCLETGERLDDRRSSKRSKRAIFFTMVRSTPKWRFLEPYEVQIQKYDESFRTPEFHKHSTIRAAFLEGTTLSSYDISDLINLGINFIWENVLDIVSGKKASRFTSLHYGPDGQVEKRYLE